MAQNKATTIEDLPYDALQQIVIRVAGTPNGAVDVARTFAVYNIFGTFLEDKEVLRAVSFKDCLSRCKEQEMVSGSSDVGNAYEKFQHAGGLLVKCTLAGNPEAQFLLSKVVLVSTSRIFNTEKVKNLPEAEEPLRLSQGSGSNTMDHNKTKLAEARAFIQYFSPPVIDNGMVRPVHLVHLMVSNFLSKAKVADLCEMSQYLKDYVTYNLVSGKEAEYKQFLNTLDKVLWVCGSSQLSNASDPQLAIHFEQSRNVCNIAHQVFRNFGIFNEEQLRPLEISLVQANNPLTPEALLDSWSILIPMLELAGQLVEHRIFAERVLINNIHHTAIVLWGFCKLVFANMKFLQDAHLILTSEFYDIFNSK